MGAQFSKTRSTFLRFFEIFGNAKKHVFTCLSFSCFYIIFSVFLEALGLLLASFWSLCRLFGFLVSSFRVPLARLGCLWTLTATFCGAFGSSGLSVGSGTAPGLFFAPFWDHFGIILYNFGSIFGPFKNPLCKKKSKSTNQFP